jgi:hypothetical protein
MSENDGKTSPCPKGGQHGWQIVGRDQAHDKNLFECSKCDKAASAPYGMSPGPMDD